MPNHLYIVTGSSRGLGLALAEQLLQPGHQVLGLARRQNDALAARAQAMAAASAATAPPGAPATPVPPVALTQWAVDLSDPALAAERLGDWLRAAARQPVASATLVNNAGAIGLPAPLGEVPLATLQQTLRVGLEATLLLTAAFLAATRDWRAPRRVMNISSGLGRRAMAGSAVYCAAKAGMDHLSSAVALEEAARPNGARIVSIAPGVVDTDMQAELRGADAARFPERARFADLHAQGQLQSASDCAARLLAYLHSERFGTEVIADIRSV